MDLGFILDDFFVFFSRFFLKLFWDLFLSDSEGILNGFLMIFEGRKSVHVIFGKS